LFSSENVDNPAELEKMDQPLAFFTFLILLLISNLITWILRYLAVLPWTN
jgi:hypothetical protein